MARSPKPSVERDIGELFGKVNMLIWGGGGLAALLVALAGGGFTVYRELDREIAALRTEVALVKRDTSETLIRVKAIEQASSQARAADAEIQGAIRRIETRLSSANPSAPGILTLNTADMKLVADVLAAAAKDFKPTLAFDFPLIGDLVKAERSDPIPDALLQKVPQLKGLRYTVDAKHNIVLLAGSNNRVVGVVPPN